MQPPIVFKPNALDFSPLSDAIGNWQGIQFKTIDQENQRRRMEMERARLAMEQEKHPLALTHMQQGIDRERQTLPLDLQNKQQGIERERQSLPLDLAAKRTSLAGAGLDVEAKRDARIKDIYGTAAAIAQLWENKPEAEQKAMLSKFYASDPRLRKAIAENMPKELVDDPVAVSRYMRAVHAGYQAPQTMKVGKDEAVIGVQRDPNNPANPPKIGEMYKNPGNDAFKDEHQLRGELASNPTIKNFSEIKSGYGRMLEGQKAATGAGDLAIVYGYMKMLDPTSVVREGEFATAEKTAGVPEQVRIMYNKILSGERLSPTVRESFLGMSQGLYGRAMDDVNKINSQYRDLALRNKLRPENVILDHGIANDPAKARENLPRFNPPKAMQDAVNGRGIDKPVMERLPERAPSQQIPPQAVRALQSNPDLAADFDAKYGPGAARQFLTPR